ncbi:MAG: XRE family transcriptional regulator [Acutalibacteraceae bacterium]|nr:XRE family transcriptional regulator [Acutalibacteraceae bacterium]
MSDLGNKEIFAKNLNYYMNINKKDRNDVARDLDLPYTTVTSWCKGEFYPRIDKIQLLANYFGIQKSDLVESKSKTDLLGNSVISIPILGTVKAGYDYLADENIIDYIPVTDSSLDNENFFALKVKGDSMVPEIYDGDIAIVRKQDDFENGDYVVALVNGDEATIKKGYKTDTGLLLQPVNTSVPPLIFDKETIKNMPIKIIGVVYNITRSFK